MIKYYKNKLFINFIELICELIPLTVQRQGFEKLFIRT